jgi:hypothetical protein
MTTILIHIPIVLAFIIQTYLFIKSKITINRLNRDLFTKESVSKLLANHINDLERKIEELRTTSNSNVVVRAEENYEFASTKKKRKYTKKGKS